MNSTPLLEFRGISKSFGSNKANQDVSFSVQRNTFHGLVGENGAGKSTIMKICYGLLTADSGMLLLQGQPTRFRNPQEAIRSGIGMVHQHFMLVPTLTVWENVILGFEPKGFQLNPTQIMKEVDNLQKEFGFSLDLTQTVENLSLGEQQQIEILKLLYRKADILILDEPTAVLTPQEVNPLFEKLKLLQEQGKTVVVITHKLKEILAFTQRVTVMRGGRVITTKDTNSLDESRLSELIIGRPRHSLPKRNRSSTSDHVVLQLESVSTRSASGRQLDQIDLSLKSGQIIGIAGIEGQGQNELVEVLCQLRPFFGSAVLLGEPLTQQSAYKRRQKGFSLVPPDRQTEGLVLAFSNADNLLLGHQRESDFKTNGLLSPTKIQLFAESLMTRFDVRPNKPQLPSFSLSGGNQQKLLIARETQWDVKFLLACHPTRGVDIGSIEFIHSHFLKLADEGAGILLISSDLDELFSLSDTVAVMREGRLVFKKPTTEVSPTELGLWMTGAHT